MILNPFSTRFTDPRTCEYVPQDSDGSTCKIGIPEIVGRFRDADYLGQILGPHGSGKTTLAVMLSRALSDRFSDLRLVTIRKGQKSNRMLDFSAVSVTSELKPTQFYANSRGRLRNRSLIQLNIVDGVELLSPLNRRLLIRSARRSDGGWLFTVHQQVSGIDDVASLIPSLVQFRKIVNGLQQNSSCRVGDSEIADSYLRHRGNYRLGLFRLYDLFASCAEQPHAGIRDRKDINPESKSVERVNPAATIAAVE